MKQTDTSKTTTGPNQRGGVGLRTVFGLALTLGWRNIHRQRRRSLIIISSAMVGITGIIFFMGFISGMKKSMLETNLQSGLGDIQIRPAGYQESKNENLRLDAESAKLTLKILKDARNNPHLPATYEFSPRFDREAVVSIGGRSRGVLVLGVDPEREKQVSHFYDWKQKGEFLKKPSKHDQELGIIPVYMGEANARYFDTRLGDLVVLSLNSLAGNLERVSGRVTGIFNTPADPIEKYTLLVRRGDLSAVYSRPHKNQKPAPLTGFYTLKFPESAMALKSAPVLRKAFENRGDAAPYTGGPPEVLTYNDLAPALTKLLEMSDQFSLIFYLILLTGFGLTLFNTLTVSVMERTYEIGVMLAIGSRRFLVFLTILMESAQLALTGGVLGIGVGGLVVWYYHANGLSLRAFSHGMEVLANSGPVFYPYLTVGDFISCFVLTLSASFLAGIYPAWRASRLEPREALHAKG